MDSWRNSMIDDLFRDWLLRNTASSSQPESPKENIGAPFSHSVGTAHHEAPSSNLLDPLHQNWFINTPGSTFHPELTFQSEPSFLPEPTCQPEYAFQREATLQSELSERISRAQGKQPMPNSPTKSRNLTGEVSPCASSIMMPFYQEQPPSRTILPLKDIMKMVAAIPSYCPWFEWLQKDSLAFINDYNNGVESIHPFKEQSVNVATSNFRRIVRKKRPFKCNTTIVVYGKEMDISEMPRPFCSCTGIPRTCDRWGEGGWTSVCCTASLSVYPLPLFTGKFRVARMMGRRMGSGTYARVIEQMVAAGHNLNNPIDLKEHWCRHGATNSSRVKR